MGWMPLPVQSDWRKIVRALPVFDGWCPRPRLVARSSSRFHSGYKVTHPVAMGASLCRRHHQWRPIALHLGGIIARALGASTQQNKKFRRRPSITDRGSLARPTTPRPRGAVQSDDEHEVTSAQWSAQATQLLTALRAGAMPDCSIGSVSGKAEPMSCLVISSIALWIDIWTVRSPNMIRTTVSFGGHPGTGHASSLTDITASSGRENNSRVQVLMSRTLSINPVERRESGLTKGAVIFHFLSLSPNEVQERRTGPGWA